jgi:hypothetical protein
VKRTELVRQLTEVRCVLLRHGARHDIYLNPTMAGLTCLAIGRGSGVLPTCPTGVALRATYSLLSAVTGSMPMARRPGTQEATATRSNSKADMAR